MAGVGVFMQVTPVDSYNNLFHIVDVFPQHIVDAVLATDWLNLPWQRQEGQESWARRKIDNLALPWITQWDNYFSKIIPQIEHELGKKLHAYQSIEGTGTAWWVDEPGFTCPIHTDGEMPGAMQLTWIGADSRLGTTFYHYKNPTTIRYKFPMQPNAGYIMINSLTSEGARHLQWHGMLHPVPLNSFRLCSYSWLAETI